MSEEICACISRLTTFRLVQLAMGATKDDELRLFHARVLDADASEESASMRQQFRDRPQFLVTIAELLGRSSRECHGEDEIVGKSPCSAARYNYIVIINV